MSFEFALKPSSFTACIRLACLTTMTTLCGVAAASSPGAWTAHDKEVATACVKASGLKNTQAAGRSMVYDDGVGITALVISGQYPQRHMKNRTGRELCLFNRKTHAAVVLEADQLSLSKPAATPARK